MHLGSIPHFQRCPCLSCRSCSNRSRRRRGWFCLFTFAVVNNAYMYFKIVINVVGLLEAVEKSRDNYWQCVLILSTW